MFVQEDTAGKWRQHRAQAPPALPVAACGDLCFSVTPSMLTGLLVPVPLQPLSQ